MKKTFLVLIILFATVFSTAHAGCIVKDGVTYDNCWVVSTSSGDENVNGSLEWCIKQSINSTGSDYVSFNVVGNINVDTRNFVGYDVKDMYIDGSSASGYSSNSNPVVEITSNYAFLNGSIKLNFIVKGITFNYNYEGCFSVNGDNIKILNCIFNSQYDAPAIFPNGTKILIKDCYFGRNISNSLNNVIRTHDYIRTGSSCGTDITIDNCVFDNSDSPIYYGNDWGDPTGSGVKVYRCNFYNCFNPINSTFYINRSDLTQIRKIGVAGLYGVSSQGFFVEIYSISNGIIFPNPKKGDGKTKNLKYEGTATVAATLAGDWTFDISQLNSSTELTAFGTDLSSCGINTSFSESFIPCKNLNIDDVSSTQCVSNNSLTLNGYPSGGSFSGTAVSNNTFSPSTAGVGSHVITYTYNCSGINRTVSKTINVYSNTSSLTTNLPAFIGKSASAISLSGSPSGGVFTGGGVAGNQTSGYTFNPSSLTPGNNSITYTYTNANGCSSSTSATTFVMDIAGLPARACSNGSNITLSGSPSGGSFSGSGVSGNTFNPATAGTGAKTITYTYNNNGTNVSTSKTITVYAPTVASILNSETNLSSNSTPINLSGSPSGSGGAFSGPGVSGNAAAGYTFNPIGQSGDVTINFTYTNANGCVSTATKSINVFTFDLNSPPFLCMNDPKVRLIGSPAGGVFSGIGVTQEQATGYYYFNPAYTSQTVYYKYAGNTTSKYIPVETFNTPSFSLSKTSFSKSDVPIVLTPGSGLLNPYFSGEGVSGYNPTIFNPNNASYGNIPIVLNDYKLVQYQTNPPLFHVCSSSISQTVTVLDIVNLPLSICISAQPLDLTPYGQPMGGSFSGPGVTGNSFDPSQSGGIGEKTIVYTYGQGTASSKIVVYNSLGGIPSITPAIDNYSVFTNVNSELKWMLNSYSNSVYSFIQVQIAPSIIDPTSGVIIPDAGLAQQYSMGYFPHNDQQQTLSLSNFNIQQQLQDKTYFWRIKMTTTSSTPEVYYSEYQRFTLKGTQQPTSSPAFPSAIASTDVINHTYEASFLDGGKTSESIAYTDGLGNTRQVQTKLNTESKFMAVETAYSEEGGGSVQTLPAPTDNTQFAYAKNFFDVAAGSGTKDFTTEDFDRVVLSGSDSILANATPLAAASSLATYYSANNPTDAYVDDAEGYPYSYGVGMKNPLGKVQLTAGAGNTFRYKQDGTGKNTSYSYTAVASEDLIRIFGKTAAGQLKSVSATTSIDPNGVENITFQEKEGKVLATAINACAVPTMDKPVEDGNTDFPATYNILEDDPIDLGTLEKTTSKSFNISCANTAVAFAYNFNLKTLPTEGTVQCISCQYDIDLKIVENATGKVVHTDTYSVPSTTATAPASCSTSTAQPPNSKTVTILRPGSYTAFRTIRPKMNPTTGKTVVEEEFERYKAAIDTDPAYARPIFDSQLNTKEEWYLLRNKRTFKNQKENSAKRPQNLTDWREYLSCIVNPFGASCNKWYDDVWYVDDFSLSPAVSGPNGLFPGLSLSGTYKNINCTSINYSSIFKGANFADPSSALALGDATRSGLYVPGLSDLSSNFRKGPYDGGSLCTQDIDINLQGYINIPTTGVYTFSGVFDDGITISIDNAPVFSGVDYFYYNTTAPYNKVSTPQKLFAKSLTAGLHPIQIHFTDYTPPYYFVLFWNKPGDASYTFSKVGDENFFFSTSTPLYRLSNLDGKFSTNGTENYLIEGISNETASTQTANFLAAYNRQNYKGLTSANIVSIFNYDIVDANGNSQISNLNASKYIPTLFDDNTLSTTKQTFSLIKVKYTTGGCANECYVNQEPLPTTSAACTTQCAEQQAALDQDVTLKLADYNTSTAAMSNTSYNIPDPNCAIGASCSPQSFSIDAIKNLYSNPTTKAAFLRNWSTTFDAMDVIEATPTQTTKGSKALQEWIGATERYNAFSLSNCNTDCMNPQTAANVCKVAHANYKSCVSDNIEKIAAGFDYLSNYKVGTSTTAFKDGGAFPYMSINDMTIDEKAKLGEPMFNYIYNNFNSTTNLVQNYNLFWSLATGYTPSSNSLTYTYGTCPADANPITNDYISNFSAGLVKVLEDANQNCQTEYKRTIDLSSGDNSVCVDANGDGLDDECIASLGTTYTSAQSAKCACSEIKMAMRVQIISSALIEAYPNPDDLYVKQTAMKAQDAGAYWLWLMGTSNVAYSPALLTLTELKKYMINYMVAEKCMATCNNRNNQAYEDWKKDAVTKYKSQIIQNFINSCYGQMNEQLTVSYNAAKYHYTLYTYDDAGRLTQTVPPEGITLLNPNTCATSPTTANCEPVYRMATNYTYNSLGQLVSTTTPDGGTTQYAYDELGRVRFSESAAQASTKCSYTKYDASSRIIETGEVVQSFATAKSKTEPIDQNWTDGLPKNDQINYYYDTPKIGLAVSSFTQDYTDGRLSYLENGSMATYYSYDVHGRVKALVHEYKALTTPAEKYKKIRYEYQPISGIVNRVYYQEGVSGEQFIHKYTYDNDNRLQKVEVSKDNTVWEPAGEYTYYTHGPLKTLALGDHVQRLNYTYNLQGWLKAINHPNTDLDPGQDGVTGSTSPFAKDVFGMILSYYAGDYVRSANIPAAATTKNISLNLAQSAAFMPVTDATPGNKGFSLYNGNIAGILNYTGFDQTNSMASTQSYLSQRYRYDYLNRLTGNFAETQGSLTSPVWASASTGASILQELLTYDANGNINTLKRSGALSSTYTDNLTYKYPMNTDPTPKKLQNQLKFIMGSDGSGLLPIQTCTTYVNSNYNYDAKGRLTRDVSESIGTAATDGITWTSFDKIASVIRTGTTTKSNLFFTYDPLGRRVSKRVMDPNNASVELFTEYYVYDASGNTMAVYKKAGAAALALQETYMYGSSRLGLHRGTAESISKSNLDFELTDHLGNVRAVVEGDAVYDGTSASPILYDGFSYTASQPLSGNGGGSGWASNLWTAPSNSYEVATTAPFAYTNLSPTAGHAEALGGGIVIGRALDASAAGPFKVTHSVIYMLNSVSTTKTWVHDHTNGAGLLGNSTRTTWLSFYIRKNTAIETDEASLSLTSDATPTTRTTVPLAIGYFGSASATAGVKYWSVKVGGTVYKSTVPVALGSTCFVMVEIGQTSVKAYFNPTIDANGLLTSAPSLTAPASGILYKNIVYYGGQTAGHSAIDEIKIGESAPNVINFSGSAAPRFEKLLLHEPFDYTPGDLNGKTGGTTSWIGAWTKAGASAATTSNTSLANGDLQVAGGKAGVTGNTGTPIGRQVDVSATGPLAAVLTPANQVGKAGTTVWTSVLMQLNTTGTEENSLSFGTGATAVSLGNNPVSIGYFGTASQDVQNKRYWTLKVGNTLVKTTKEIVVNQSTFLVLRTDYTASGGTVYLYVNPNFFPSTTNYDATAPATADISFKNVVYVGNNGLVDEIRIGTSYAAVRGASGKRADLTYLADYYPFGSVMPTREFTADNYRYGFNGMEKDIQTGTYTTEFRMLDTKIGDRWWSPDPIVKPWESPYAGMHNNSIIFTDRLGLDPVKRYSFGQRTKNFFKGEGFKNRANRHAAERGIDDAFVKTNKEGGITIDESTYSTNKTGSQEGLISAEMQLNEKYTKFNPSTGDKVGEVLGGEKLYGNSDGMNAGSGGPQAVAQNINVSAMVFSGSANLVYVPNEGLSLKLTGAWSITKPSSPSLTISQTQYFFDNPNATDKIGAINGTQANGGGQLGPIMFNYGRSALKNNSKSYAAYEYGFGTPGFSGGAGVSETKPLLQITW